MASGAHAAGEAIATKARAAGQALGLTPEQLKASLEKLRTGPKEKRLKEAGDILAMISGRLSPQQATDLLRDLKARHKAVLAAGGPVKTPTRFEPQQTKLGVPLIAYPDGKLRLVLAEGQDGLRRPAIFKSAVIDFQPGKISIAQDERVETLEEQQFRGAAEYLSRMSQNLSPDDARKLLFAATDHHRRGLQNGHPTEPTVHKRRDTGLPRTLQHNPDGSIVIWMKDQIGKGGFKVAKRAALIRFDDRGGFTIHQAVKTTGVVGTKGRPKNTEHLSEQAAQEKMRGAANVSQMHVGFERSVSRPDGLKVKHVQIQDYYGGGDLFGRLTSKQPLTDLERAQYGHDILSGMAALHGKGLMHLDFKPENTFLNNEGRAFVADLGMARGWTLPQDRKFYGGTKMFFAPEFTRQLAVDPSRVQRSPQEDVFATGMVLHALKYGRYPAFADQPFQTRHVLMDANYMKNTGLVPQGKDAMHDLIARMLSPDPGQRPTIWQALQAFDGILTAQNTPFKP